MTFGERVKQARLAKGLTQSQLAKCAGYAGATSDVSLLVLLKHEDENNESEVKGYESRYKNWE